MLTNEQIKDEASHHGFIGNTEMLVNFARAIEAEVRMQDTALIRQLVEALDTCGVDYGGDDHAFKTFDDEMVQSAITAARARLPNESPGGPDVDHPL